MIGILKKAVGRTARNLPTVSHLPGIDPFVAQRLDMLLQTGRCCQLMKLDSEEEVDSRVLGLAWLCAEKEMALVPGGSLLGQSSAPDAENSANVESLYLDRYAVTNQQFHRFVEDGGYGRTELWPSELWTNVLQFVDRTGQSGPRFWENGRPRKQDLQLPVVGISWYEAAAYASWAGKRLPSSIEWQHACTWCAATDGRQGNMRYPWGNTFDAKMANTWVAANGGPVAVDNHYEGATPNGVYQLIGNVWEWVSTPYRCGTTRQDITVFFEQPMAEIRGGAFDTYFEDQATTTFRTGLPYLYRRHNVGFRCCTSANQLKTPADPDGFGND